MDCIDNIIGISKNGCNCVDIDASLSLSGLFLDDTTVGRIPLSAMFFDCGDSNLKELLERVIPEANKEALELLGMEMGTAKKGASFNMPIKKDFSGVVGAANFYAFTIRARQPNLQLHLKSAAVKTLSGLELVTIYKNGEVVTDTLIKLDADVHFVFSGDQPVNHKIRCCGNGYNTDSLIEFGSGQFANLEDVKFTSSSYANGFIIDGFISCDAFGFLCDMDFINHSWGRTYAKLVQLIARKNMLHWIVRSGKVTTYLTVMEGEIEGLMIYLNEQIDQRIKFLPTVYNFTDCMQCRSQFGTILI